MLRGIVLIALKRLWSRPGQALLALLGVILALGLATSVPIFSQAVDLVMLRAELSKLSSATERPPFCTRIYILPSRRKPLSLKDCEQLGAHIADTLASEVSLPLKRMVMRVESGGMMLRPQADDTRFGEKETYLGTVNIASMPGIGSRMEIIAGKGLDEEDSEGDVEVWMHTDLAKEMGVRVGEAFEVATTGGRVNLPVRVAGIWQARDADDPFWWSQDPDSVFRDMLLVRREDYLSRVEPHIPSKTGFDMWYIVLDDSKILPQRSGDYITGLERALAVINKYLTGARMDISPLGPLKNFHQRSTVMMTLLLGFSVPAMGFLLYFLALISVIIVRWQRRETAVMISRGLGRGRILAIALLEGLILIGVGYPLGIGLGMLLARLMGYTLSFLSFVSRSPLPVSLRGLNPWLIAAALGASLVARLWPTIRSTRHSVVAYEQEHSRPIRKPLWQRYYLDLLLAIPTAYAYHQMGQWGSLGLLAKGSTSEIYKDPLVILVPTLFVLTASLLSMRIFPLMMRLADRLAAASPWISLHLPFRQLSRRSQQYINPLLLVIAALSLGTYLASMAASLDQWLVDRMYYSVGADVTFKPFVDPEQGATGSPWSLPVSEYLTIQGVQRATRVGDYPADVPASGGEDIMARFLGIERLNFPAVAWFRSDFTSVPLGELMNRLALHPDGVLAPKGLLEANHLNIGDQLQLRVGMDDVDVSVSTTIVGTYRHFPTVYEDRPTLVGNLSYLFSQAGGIFPHYIWMRVEPGVDSDKLFDALETKVVEITKSRDTRALIKAEQDKMERVGVFGTLSVDFLAAAVMAGIGLLVYNYASLRERFFRFAVLRAIGLSGRQLIGQVVLEYCVLTFYGAVNGVLIGVLVSRLFIPFFQVTGEEGASLPPLLSIVAGDKILHLAVWFVAAMILTQVIVVAVGVRRGLFQALRMGE
ncbi:MAG: ABC transporter permease [Chloroflexota bacterium]|nr:ABC transporter permease [Chloroflexota bacterium]